MQPSQNRAVAVVVALVGCAAAAHAGIVPISQGYQISGEANVSSKALGGADTQGFNDANELSGMKPSMKQRVLKNSSGIAALLESKSQSLYAWTDASAYTSTSRTSLMLESTAGGAIKGAGAKGDAASFVSKSAASISFEVTSPIEIAITGWLDGAPATKEGKGGFTRWASLALSSEKEINFMMSSDSEGFEGATKFSESTKLAPGLYRLDVASYVDGADFESLDGSSDAFAGSNIAITVVPTPATAALALIGAATMARRRRA